MNYETYDTTGSDKCQHKKFNFRKLKFSLELWFKIVYNQHEEVITVETTSDRLQQLMRERNLKQVDIIQLAEPFCRKYKIKLNKSDMSQFVSGKTKPGQWKLTILGLALNVSEAWLMGYDAPMERTQQPPTEENERLLDDEIIHRLRQLTPDELSRVDAFVQGLLASR